MKKRNATMLLCLVMLLALMISGCGRAAMDAATAPGAPMPMPAPEAEAAPMEPGYGQNGMNYTEMGEEDFSYTSDSLASAPESQSPLELEQKLVYTVDLTIETLEYETSLRGVEQLTAEYGGYIEYAQSENNSINSNRMRSANYTLRIPAERLEQFLDSCGNVGNVLSNTRYTDNRTMEYADLSARLKTLRIEEETLQELLSQAEDLETIVALNGYLSDVRYEIERIEGQMRGIDSLASYSTVYLYLREVKVATEVTTPQSSFGERVSARMGETWNNFTEGLERFGVFAFGELPLLLLSVLLYLLPVIIVLIILIVLIRRARKKRRAKKLQPPEATSDDGQN